MVAIRTRRRAKAFGCALVGVLWAALGSVAHAQTPTLTTLHALSGGGDGSNPKASLLQGSDGLFYGTTWQGGGTGCGATGCGTVFRMASDGTLTTLHAFSGPPGDGANPTAGVIQATDGNFYGTTTQGGAAAFGTVFRMTPAGAVTILHSFSGWPGDGALPAAVLLQGRDGSIYGTTRGGGPTASEAGGCCGTIFQMSPGGVVTILHSFNVGTADGEQPAAGLLQASDGNFYGTTSAGGLLPTGVPAGGTLFQMTPAGAVTILHAFSGTNGDGADPEAGVIPGSDGALYGTTANGGSANAGTVFRWGVPSTTDTGGGDGGGDGGHHCFIATAAFGSPLAPEVQTLRTFRDRYLLPTAPGRWVVRQYYAVTPPIAEVLTNHPALRAGTRVLLRPVIWAAQGALEAPFLAFAVGAVLGLGPWVVVRQWWRGWRGRR